MDVHRIEGGDSAAHVADAHHKDLETQDRYGISHQRHGTLTSRRRAHASLGVVLTLGAAATLLVAQPWEADVTSAPPATSSANAAEAANALVRDQTPGTVVVGSTSTTAANALAHDHDHDHDRRLAPIVARSSAADAANALARDRAPRPLVGADAADAANALRRDG